MQLRLLEEIGRQASGNPALDELVFHGGTSLSLIHGSPRWSEDLDFMGSPEAVATMMERRAHLETALQLRASVEMPGAKVTVSAKRRHMTPEPGDVDKFMVRWEHPEHIGVVKVKVEFYVTPAENIAAYEAEAQAPHVPGLRSRYAVRAATLTSIWADKIIAIAQRPMFKQRDVHDLGYLSNALKDDADRDAALKATMGIYRRKPTEILEGLERDLVRAGVARPEDFQEEMARWFTEAEMLEMKEAGVLKELFEGFESEFLEGCERVVAMAMPAADMEMGAC